MIILFRNYQRFFWGDTHRRHFYVKDEDKTKSKKTEKLCMKLNKINIWNSKNGWLSKNKDIDYNNDYNDDVSEAEALF